jgi:uncharacterized protein YndB with AHSA1/START domain
MSSVAPVRKNVVVEASQAKAFAVFSEGIDRWWPREHHSGSSPLKRAVLEARLGGRWYSICEDGTEFEVGKVLAFEPPRRLVLAWQLDANWQYEASFSTEVEVTFTAEGPKRTRVELEHRGMERYGAAVEEVRRSLDAQGGWLLTLENFARAAATEG